jgi:tRNA-2-methylthio-N6-dimethylallyladenosine synthase
MAQRLGTEIIERAPQVDLVVGTGAYGRIFEMLARLAATGEPQVDVAPGGDFAGPGRPRLEAGRIRTFVSIMEGCNKSCSFCIVPRARGRERYKPLEMIVAECAELAGRGVREITLLGQNINSWRQGKLRFADVLTAVNRVDGLVRIRFSTSHPINTDPLMLEAMARAGKVCEALQLPLQSGSDRVLALMRRGYSLDRYRKLAAMARSLMPGLALTTDIIVGFPGESDEDFELTVRAMEEIRFDSAFMFTFSPRRGTRASVLPDRVPREVADERLQRVIALQRRVTAETSRARVGGLEEVLVDGPHPRRAPALTGKTRTFKPAVFAGPPEWIGSLRRIRVTAARGVTLYGEAADGAPPPA